MDTNREKSESLASGASIRLRYSTQFSSGGRAQNIDTEISLPIGVSQETREQIIREAEQGVEQLMRQITQRGHRPPQNTRASEPAPLRPNAEAASRSAAPVRTQHETTTPNRQASSAPSSLPPPRTPISESMPTTPNASGGGRAIRLADFINAIMRRWNMSPKEAMDLLGVDALDGLNYRETYRQLEEIVKQKNAQSAGTQNTSRQSAAPPIVEAPRSSNRSTTQQAPARTPQNVNTSTTPTTKVQSSTALKQAPRTAPQSAAVTREIPATGVQENTAPPQSEPGQDFAGSPKAPIPLHIGVGVVREPSAPQSYTFDEEDGEDETGEEYELPTDDEEQAHLSARMKLDELKTTRGTSAASAERLTVLNNVMSSQISDEQLQKIMQAAWNITSKKRLKAAQVEALVSWAKEDFFMEEVEAMLALIDEGEA